MGYFKQKPKVNVVYRNGVKDHISPALLATLISSKQIDKFERTSGWVQIGVDPVRGAASAGYSGPERRAS
ncbi:hypothetical protein SAMN05660420_00298 [Desulfuromusa kysingii]|uniref:Uncharacterized protein n=1 Tax=Desulfuromusa kysingii TaxID=37625 RepID=A0A1H3VWY7_9BACT|nr:hypothetical protein [Desulfuromusa kysingii]SDZ78568.1 hypothetical protein SAMN05660420_00298 [Desulfuromusa kysingii]